MNYLDGNDDGDEELFVDPNTGDKIALALQPKAFDEVFKKMSLEHQQLIIFAGLKRQLTFLAKQFSICCYLASLQERKKLSRPLTSKEKKFIELEEKTLAELYRDQSQKPN